MKSKEEAIRILQNASTQVANTGHGYPIASEALTHLHNAVFYLLTGRLPK
jgi:hypothetical protein